MKERENYLRVLEFRSPQWIPFRMLLAWPLWNKYREDLEDLVLRHPKIFGKREKGDSPFDFDPGPMFRKGEYYRDDWGCLWYNTIHGLQGQVVESPLAGWQACRCTSSLVPIVAVSPLTPAPPCWTGLKIT